MNLKKLFLVNRQYQIFKKDVLLISAQKRNTMLGLDDFRSIYLPYCLKKQKDNSYAVLNRQYKPVGFNTDDVIDYNDYPVTTKFKGISPSLAKKLSYDGSDDTESIYLYNDGCNPINSKVDMDVYMKKLTLLAKLKVHTQ